MTSDSKRMFAAELLRLSKFDSFRLPDDVPDSTRAMIEAIKERHFDALVGLYAEHFSEEQLQAQLDFHRSEMGRAILRVQERIGEEYYRITPTFYQPAVTRGVDVDQGAEAQPGAPVARTASIIIDTHSLADFAEEARKFCRWATGEDGSEMTVGLALRRLSRLYAAALSLPLPFTQGLGEAAVEVDLPSAWLELVSKRAATLPVLVYWDIFAPIEDPPAEPLAGSIVDDLTDIYRDVARGRILFEAGDRAEAQWEWAFNFRAHWGEHATGAIRALHAFLAQEYPDGLSGDAKRGSAGSSTR